MRFGRVSIDSEAEITAMPIRRSNPTDPAKAIALIRVSTEKQDLSPAAQSRAINAFAKSHGITVVKVFEEIGISGGAALENRPVLMEAIDAVRTQHAGILLVAKRDRLARDVVAAGLITRLVERNGGVVRTSDGIGNGEDAESKLLAGIVDLFAQYERAVIKGRTRAALALKRSRGEALGGSHAPFGFRFAKARRAGKIVKMLVSDPKEQEIVLRIVRLRRRGRSLESISMTLNRAGVPTKSGGRWFAMSVKRVLRTASEPVAA